MPIRLGASTPSRIYLGSNEIAAAYIGATQVWPEGPVYDPATMVLTMATTGASAEERTVRIPFASTSLNVTIDWGDGTVTNHVAAANPERVYANEGTYTIQVTGAARTLGASPFSTRWSTKLRSIVQWGDLGLTSLANGFRGYTGTSLPLPSDLPSGVTNLAAMFRGATALVTPPDVSGWDVSNCTSLWYCFDSCSKITSPFDVSTWDVSKVTDLTHTFQGWVACTTPPDVSTWNVGAVTDLYWTFNGLASTTPPDVSGWNVSNVTNMAATFRVGGFTSPPDVSGWNTVKVQTMRQVFQGLGSLDIPADNWSIAGVTTPSSFDNMFLGTTLPTARYDALLTKWEAQAVKPVGANFHGGSSKYTAAPSAAATARASLANPATNNWTIADGGT